MGLAVDCDVMVVLPLLLQPVWHVLMSFSGAAAALITRQAPVGVERRERRCSSIAAVAASSSLSTAKNNVALAAATAT